ncbi:signal peptide, CUB and EGF-like domain-containing protein 3 [Elysia marginata]|uniref:Signal peptide, CUB and EGF-like domain-containing protein 3 n=1 Tax=Elysia marginata TaxID=1093978 RepID=A0AAV4JKW5_9GAST|nr:signal peptide, CUB and EGF-like domain-containing protein 3 [Elysia marginata]
MLKAVEEKTAFEMPNIASAQLLADVSEVDSEPLCAEGYRLTEEHCVECGPGSYYDASSKMCKLCPLHEYTDTAGMTQCDKCTGGLGTLQRGSNSSMDCVSLCSVGNMYNVSSGTCEPCPKNFYQNETGQPFCYPCRPSSGTEKVGSTSESECKDYCPGGTELRGGVCTKCKRGFYRVGFQQDACKPCMMANMTTREEGSDLEDQCDIPKCPAGQYVKEDGEDKSCELCAYGFYQPEMAQFSCEPCVKNAKNYTTENMGSVNSTECRFLCPPGQQETSPGSLQCSPCPRGTYRNDSLASRFAQCETCPTGLTTVGKGMDHIDNCSMTACPPGQFVDVKDNKCYSCGYGFYQPLEWQTGCKKCPPKYTTENMGSVNGTECRFLCPPGEEENPPNSQNCSPCERGYWRSGSLDMRFLNCTACTGGMTTQGAGANSFSDCMIRICTKGSYRNASTNNCIKCPLDSYQDEDLMDECKPCLNGRKTKKTGSNKVSDCEFVCPPGQQVFGLSTCLPCARGSFKNESMTFEKCANCTDGTTTESFGANTDQLCNIAVCRPGYVVSSDNSTCDRCPVDQYQPVDIPFSTTKCQMCDENTGTMQDARVSKSECTKICRAGYGLSNDDCKPCGRGLWNNGNLTMRFEQCQACPDGFTTLVTEGATAADNCTIRICKAGFYRNATSNKCMECPLNSYQDEDLQDKCKPCPNDRQTRKEGSQNVTDCEFVCPPGQEVDNSGAACKPCGRGLYKNETMTFDKCTNCRDNFTTDLAGSNSSQLCDVPVCQKGYVVSADKSKCDACPVDMYQPTFMPFSIVKCLMCPNNTGTTEDARSSGTQCTKICRAGYGLNTDECKPCGRGTWNNGNLTMRFEQCQACPVNFTTEVEEGATAPENCTIRDCPPGSYFDAADADACKKCPEGFYQPLYRQISCQKCPNDTSTFGTGSTNITACTIKCSAGQEDDGTEKCVSCPDDKFKEAASFGQCKDCTGDVTSSPSNRTACTVRFCDVGREDKNDKCSDCPLGFYKAERGNKACDRCPDNTTTAAEASRTAAACSVVFCEAGFFSNDNVTCVPCVVGTYKSDRGNQQCTPCTNDVTTDSIGSKQKSDCYLKLCGKGQYRNSSNICQDCSPGFYQNETGQTTCRKCPDGYTSLQPKSIEASSCRIVCPSGFYRNDTTNECVGCERGSYQSNTGATNCLSCGGNFTTTAENSTSPNDCYIQCPIGYYRANSRTCNPCGIGQYQDIPDSTSCKTCGTIQGFEGVTVGQASTKRTDCLPKCGKGFKLNLAERICSNCPIGEYKDQVSLDTECTPCTAGRTTNREGATGADFCSFEICPGGSFRAANQQSCTECDYGFFQPLSNATSVTSCSPCPNGGTTLNKGTASQDLCVLSCAAGTAFNVAEDGCKDCPLRQYRPAGVNPPWCVYCPAGTTTLTTGSSSCVATTATPAPLVRTTVVVTVVVSIGNCDNQEHIRQTIASVLLQLIQNQQTRYPDLCPTSSCDNVGVVFVALCGNNGVTRRKRQTATTATVQIAARDVSPVLGSADNANLRRDTQDVLQNALADTQPVAQALTDNQLAIQSIASPPVCTAGTRINGQRCTACTKGTYSTSPVSEVCTRCPDGTSTTGTGSSSSRDCITKCRLDPNYCGTRGNCSLRAGTTDDYYCRCNSKYSGDYCQQRMDDSDDDNLTLVVAVCGGVGGLLLLILLIIGCCVYRARQSRRTSSSGSDITEYKEYKHPHAYHNAVFTDPTMFNKDVIDFYERDTSLFNGGHSASSKKMPQRQERRTVA